jgi:hypothetical protein
MVVPTKRFLISSSAIPRMDPHRDDMNRTRN